LGWFVRFAEGDDSYNLTIKKKWFTNLKSFEYNQLNTVTNPIKLSLNNSWFSGFVDVENCFKAYLTKSNRTVSLRFIIEQKRIILI